MGNAAVQGELWGAEARTWAEIQEPAWRPVFREVLAIAGVRSGASLLDIGCGAGGALVLARELGADVTGLDASENLVAIAREQLPGARIDVGEMERLPFGDGAYDIVTGINSFQFASDLTSALAEARRVCRPNGTVLMLVWGRREDCELMTITMPAVLALLPPASAHNPAPPPLAEPGFIEERMLQAGLTPVESGEIISDLAFPDVAAALRAVKSAGAVVRAIRLSSEEAVDQAIRSSLPRVTKSSGQVVWRNQFRWVKATPTKALRLPGAKSEAGLRQNPRRDDP